MSFRVTVKMTIPEVKLTSNRLRSDIIQALRSSTVPKTISLFKQTTTGWEHKPIWSATYSNQSSRVSATVFPSGPNAAQYNIVEFGARPHVIRPRHAPVLRFQPGYRAATTPRILSSRTKQRFGERISARSVNHPGFEAREFSGEVADAIAPQFQHDVVEAIRVF